jgi:hypothetical protein
VRTKRVVRQHHDQAGDKHNRGESYRGPLHWCPFSFFGDQDISSVPEKCR